MSQKKACDVPHLYITLFPLSSNQNYQTGQRARAARSAGPGLHGKNWVESPLMNFHSKDQKIEDGMGEELHLVAAGRPNLQDR
jgi:hypothetical protein